MLKIKMRDYESFLDIKKYLVKGAMVMMEDERRGYITANYPLVSTDGFYHKLSVDFGSYTNLVEFNDIRYIQIYDQDDRRRGVNLSESTLWENQQYKTPLSSTGSAEGTKLKAKKEHSINSQPKPKFSLMPQHALLETAKVFTYGESKYDAYNYSKGEDTTVYIDAAMRHINKYLMGEDIDDETNTNHLANAVANLLMTLDNVLIGKANDNRNKEYNKMQPCKCGEECSKCK